MNILFCNFSFPGIFEQFATELASVPGNRVLFLSTFFKRDFNIPNVSLVQLRGSREHAGEPEVRNLVLAESVRLVERGNEAYRRFVELRRQGFVPDIVFTSLTEGIGLYIRMAFPEAYVVSYFEDLRRIADSPLERGRNRVEILFRSTQMLHSDLCYVMAAWHRNLLPPLLKREAKVMPYFADTDFFIPGEKAEGELVSFNLKSANHEIRRRYLPIITGLLERRSCCRAVICAGSRILRQAVENDIAALPPQLRCRCEIMDFLPVEDYRRVLQQSTLHVCPDTMEPPIREMLECLSCETLLMGPEGLSKFVLPLPAEEQIGAICSILDSRDGYDAHRRNGRNAVLRHREKKRALRTHIEGVLKEFSDTRGRI